MSETNCNNRLVLCLLECETYYWSTDEPLDTNMDNMQDFFDQLPEGAEITLDDGTYAEIKYEGLEYELHASGDGDFTHHMVEISLKENART